MSKVSIDFFIGALAAALVFAALGASTHLCDKAMNNPQAFFAGKVH